MIQVNDFINPLFQNLKVSGGLTKEQFGTDTPLYHKLQYNVRGQLWDIRSATGADVNGSWNRGATAIFYDQTYSYVGSGADNNGNVLARQALPAAG